MSLFYRLANFGQTIQHVGYIGNCVNMKVNRASVHQEAHCNIQHCASQFNNEISGSVSKGSLCQRKCLVQDNQINSQQRSTKSIATMLHTFSKLAFYLFFIINTVTIVATAATNQNQAHNNNQIGVFAALSASDSNVPTTTEFSKCMKRNRLYKKKQLE